MKCCGPATAPATAGQQSRDCYSDAQQGCCQWKAVTGFDTTTNSLTFTNMAQTFFKDTQQCCATAGGSTMMWSGGATPIAPKWVTNCAQWLLDQSTPLLCKDNSSCPTIDNVQMGCCRRPAQTQPTSETRYDYDGIGNCYDPRVRSCCGGLETGGSRQIGETFKSNYTYADPVVFDPNTAQCCKIPVNQGGQTFAISNTHRCPCMASADCPTAAHTCCAPTDVELQANTQTQGKRLMKCDPGCPTTGLSAAASSYSYFAGCLGQCIAPTGTSNTFTAEVCLTGTSAFAGRCDNVRWRNGGSLTVPSGDNLIVQEYQTHEMDCCASNSTDTVNSYSILYNTRTEVCCPVIGTSRRDKNGNLIARYLSKVVPAQGDMNNLDACMCMTDDDCPGTQKCCQNANYQFASGSASLQYKQYGGLCYDPKVTDCCSYKSQASNVTTTSAVTVATLYDPTNFVCCPTQGVVNGLSNCNCHSDAECPGPFGACCMATYRVANVSHNAGTCIDTRYQACCHYDVTDNHGRPYYSKDVAFQPTRAAAYNNATQVCCPFGGVQNGLHDCSCRYGATDCPGSSQCCAGNNAVLSPGEYRYDDWGSCFNPDTEGCCHYKWRANGDSPDIYRKKSEVCCALNGKQPDHRSCACGSSSDCPADGACCTDAEAAAAGVTTDCRWGAANCRGRCVHTKIETCCDNPHISEWANGAISTKACAAEFQKCCDGECCNKATQTCKKSIRNSRTHSWNTGAWSTYDGSEVGYHFGLDEEQKKCTTLEHSSPSIVFHTWVFPTFLSIACIVFMALGTKAAFGTDISPNVLKLGLVGLEIFVGIMSLLLLWSPLWKYGFVIVVANTVILSSFAVPGVWTRRFAVVVAVVCFLWVVEPFGSNSILNFGTTTFAGVQHGDAGAFGAWYNAHGLNYAARLLQRPRESFGPDGYEDACTLFYQYWRVDPMLNDQRTWNPLSPTRGICRRSWMHTIVVMAGLITPFQTIFLLLAGLAIARATPATKDMKVQPLA
jgi:hypothetical protein